MWAQRCAWTQALGTPASLPAPSASPTGPSAAAINLLAGKGAGAPRLRPAFPLDMALRDGRGSPPAGCRQVRAGLGSPTLRPPLFPSPPRPALPSPFSSSELFRTGPAISPTKSRQTPEWRSKNVAKPPADPTRLRFAPAFAGLRRGKPAWQAKSRMKPNLSPAPATGSPSAGCQRGRARSPRYLFTSEKYEYPT